jgi:hypothetical protein
MVLLASPLAARSRAGAGHAALLDEYRNARRRPRSSLKGHQKGQAIPGKGEQLVRLIRLLVARTAFEVRPALRDVNSLAASVALKKNLMVTVRLSPI